jgi:hypothetical protein
MRRTIVLFFILIAIVSPLSSQEELIDAVHLKNGTIIRGIIFETVPDVSLKVKTAEGHVFAIPAAKVEKIAREPRAPHTLKERRPASAAGPGQPGGRRIVDKDMPKFPQPTAKIVRLPSITFSRIRY